jgi:hypothetical protein
VTVQAETTYRLRHLTTIYRFSALWWELIRFTDWLPTWWLWLFGGECFVSFRRPSLFYLLTVGVKCFDFSLDHTQTHTTVGRITLDEGSARGRDLYLTTQTLYKTNIHAPGGIRTHDPSKRLAADLRLRPRLRIISPIGRLLTSWMWRHVGLYIDTDVSEWPLTCRVTAQSSQFPTSIRVRVTTESRNFQDTAISLTPVQLGNGNLNYKRTDFKQLHSDWSVWGFRRAAGVTVAPWIALRCGLHNTSFKTNIKLIF